MNRKKCVKNLLENLKTHIFASDYMVNCTYVQRTLQYSGRPIYYIYVRTRRGRTTPNDELRGRRCKKDEMWGIETSEERW